MAEQTGQQSTAVTNTQAPPPKRTQKHETEPYNVSYLQALRIIGYYSRQQNQPPLMSAQITPELSADLSQPEVTNFNPTQKTLNTPTLALYGAKSPLPFFYTEDLIEGEKHKENLPKQLLDVFHQRTHQINFQAQQKYRPILSVVEQQKSHFINLIYGLTGLRNKELRAEWDQYGEMYRHASLFNRHVRSAKGLKILMDNNFPKYDTEIKQCILRKITVPKEHRFILGQKQHTLGHGLILGRYAKEKRGRIQVILKSGSMRQYQQLLPDTKNWHKLETLLKSYLNGILECEIVLALASKHIGSMLLGSKKRGALGVSAWLTRKGEKMEVKRKILLEY